MSKLLSKISRAVAVVAPTLGGSLLGPLGGVAGMVLRNVLDKPDASDDELASLVATLTPDQVAALKQAEIAFKVRQAELEAQRYDADAADRASARQRETSAHDHWTIRLLAGGVMIGFFAIAAMMLSGRVGLTGEQGAIIGTMLGYVSNLAVQVMNYFFGSSSGSAEKTRLLAGK